jgi:6-pyruvoyltetrahydropterin/6-carboxytetrahydropterin synthase
MKAHLTRRYMFSASHRLHRSDLSDADNHAVYGKCNHPHGHGHNYALEVTVSGQVDPSTGMVCELVELDKTVQREVLDRFDHVNLNLCSEFKESVPTTENLIEIIFDILKQKFSAAHLQKVRLEETARNSFEYCGN